MQRAYQLFGLAFLALALYVTRTGLGLEYYTEVGPGPGFFPVWLGVALAGISFVYLLQVTLKPVEGGAAAFLPPVSAGLRILAIVLALAFFILGGEHLGFRLSMLVFLLFMLSALGRQKPLVTVLISIAGSFGVYWAFHDLLGLHLPLADIELLMNLGL